MIKLRNNKQYTNFTELTPNKITTQWNNIKFQSHKKQITLEELEYIIKTTTNKKVLEEVIPLYNTLARKHNKTSDDIYKVYNKQERKSKELNKIINENKEKKREAKLTKQKEQAEAIIDEIGYGSHMRRELYTKIGDEYVINPKMVGKSFEDIEKEMTKLAKAKGDSDVALQVAIAKKKEEYDIFIDKVKKLNKEKEVNIINETTNKRLNSFLFDSTSEGSRRNGYFGKIAGKQVEKAKLSALLNELNVGEKLAVENLMLSNDFLKVWSSDQDSPTYDEEFRENRLDEIIKIIENYKGITTSYNPTTGEIDITHSTEKQATTTSLRLEDYIGK